jgi:hypothetical protein
MRITGTAVGVQAVFAIIAAAGVVRSSPSDTSFTDAFVMGALGAGATLAAAAFLPGRPRDVPSLAESQTATEQTSELAIDGRR